MRFSLHHAEENGPIEEINKMEAIAMQIKRVLLAVAQMSSQHSCMLMDHVYVTGLWEMFHLE